jgi:hypothetical protein
VEMPRDICHAIPFVILLSIILATFTNIAFADFYHYTATCQIVCTDQNVALGGELSSATISYSGTPQPNIFMNVSLFYPFTHYVTDGETYLRIYTDTPIVLPSPPYEVKVVTFKTILNWGLPGEPTPFTYVAYGAPGYSIGGILYNYKSSSVGGVVVSVDKFVLLSPYIGLASTTMVGAVVTVAYFKRIKRRKEKQ